MSVEATLERLCDHNTAIRGALTWNGIACHKYLTGPYSAIDAESLGDHGRTLIEAVGAFEDLDAPFKTVFLEFENHSIFVRQIDDHILLLLTDPMRRSGFKKVQVGVNLFIKPLCRALASPVEGWPRPARLRAAGDDNHETTGLVTTLHADRERALYEHPEPEAEDKPRRTKRLLGIAF